MKQVMDKIRKVCPELRCDAVTMQELTEDPGWTSITVYEESISRMWQITHRG